MLKQSMLRIKDEWPALKKSGYLVDGQARPHLFTPRGCIFLVGKEWDEGGERGKERFSDSDRMESVRSAGGSIHSI